MAKSQRRHLDTNELFTARMGMVSGGASPLGIGGGISLYHSTQTEQEEADLKHPDPSYTSNAYYREDIVVRALLGDADLRAYILRMYDIHQEEVTQNAASKPT